MVYTVQLFGNNFIIRYLIPYSLILATIWILWNWPCGHRFRRFNTATGNGPEPFLTAVPKVRVLTVLLGVGTSWRCDDCLFFEVTPLVRDALLTTLHPLLENVLQTVHHFEISNLGSPFSWLEKPRNRMGRDLDCMADVLMGFRPSTFSDPNTEFNPDLAPCNSWAFPTTKKDLRGKKFRSDQRSAARFR
jgi:hypothetical protein